VIKFTKNQSKIKKAKNLFGMDRQLVGTISEFALETLRYGNDPEPLFSNGGNPRADQTCSD
jgi:hypothetical protein